jgi:transcriptional regulator with XRE-family HTH domain
MNGLTQEQFARRIGIKRSLLGAYEEARANPNLDNLMNIAKIFGTTVDNLLKNDLRRLKESKGVPLPQPSQQLAIKEEPEPPKQLATIIDKYYRSTTDLNPGVQHLPFQSPTINVPPQFLTGLQNLRLLLKNLILQKRQSNLLNGYPRKMLRNT